MKKLLILSLLAVGATTINASTVHKPLVHRNSGFYLGLNGSIQSETIEEKEVKDSGGNVIPGFVFGYKFSKPIRIELDVKLRGNPSLKEQTLAIEGRAKASVNAYYDIYTSTIFTPYFGLGFSIGQATYDGVKYPIGNSLSDGYIYKSVDLGAGTRVRLSDHVDLDLQYKYGLINFANFAANMDNVNKLLLSNPIAFRYHQATVGLIYNF